MKISRGQRVFGIFNTLIMISLVIITLYPILHTAFGSISEPSKLLAHKGLLLFPQGFSIRSYQIILTDDTIIGGLANSLFIIVVKTVLSLILTTTGAYLLSRKNALLSPIASFFIVVTMFFNGGLIPTYLNVKSLHLENTLAALIIPSAVNTVNLIIMRTAFYSVPDSLEESAMIDGAGRCRILLKIMLPLMVPTLMVITLYYIVGAWNSWFEAMIYLRNAKLFPLQLILRNILIEKSGESMAASHGDEPGTEETIKYAIIIISVIPMVLIYPFMQKHFTSGVMIGAVKG